MAEVDTPALLIDLDACDANIAQVHARCQEAGVAVRPHAKAHKTPALAQRQQAAGARGICCQKLGEAEVFADAGINDVLVTNEIIGHGKAARAAKLARRIALGLCVDHPLQVQQLGESAQREVAHIRILVEVDVGQGRCGVTTPAAALALARAIAQHTPALSFGGLHAYHGGAQHLRSHADRVAAVARVVEKVRAVMSLLAEHGLTCETITGGGTGSFANEAFSGIYTEVQPGSYLLMDTDYAANEPDAESPPMRHALFGWCSVISQRPSHAVLDGGLKAFAVDSGLPHVLHAGWAVECMSDEHTVIVPGPGAAVLSMGEKLRVLPGHCDPTVNLHDWLVAMRGERVEQVYRVAARGALR